MITGAAAAVVQDTKQLIAKRTTGHLESNFDKTLLRLVRG
jgi:hypothetical protein